MTAHRFFAFLLAVTLAFAMLSPALAEESAAPDGNRSAGNGAGRHAHRCAAACARV